MDQFNKAISFILGLVVVAVFIAVASGRINLKDRVTLFSKLSSSSNRALTPTLIPTPTSVPKKDNTQTSFLGNLFNFGKPKTTPTPTSIKKQVIPTLSVISTNNTTSQTSNTSSKTNGQTPESNEYHRYTGTQNVASIPNTGPSLLLPLILSSLFGGIYLNKKSKN